jgi:hypothetical protein
MDVEEASYTLYESFLVVLKFRSCDFLGSFWCLFGVFVLRLIPLI